MAALPKFDFAKVRIFFNTSVTRHHFSHFLTQRHIPATLLFAQPCNQLQPCFSVSKKKKEEDSSELGPLLFLPS